MKPVNVLPIFDDVGNMLPQPHHVLIGAMNYPECPASIALMHMMGLLGDDGEQPTHSIYNLVNNDVQSRVSKGITVAKVAGNLVHMHEAGLEPSLNKSVYLTLETMKNNFIGVPGSRKGQKPFPIKSTSGVRKAHRELKSVAHLWLAVDCNYEAFSQIERSTKHFEFFLEICRACRHKLQELPHYKQSELMDIPDTSLVDQYYYTWGDKGAELSTRLSGYIAELR